MTVFNRENSGWKTKKYPLFLGEELGVYDAVNQPYPRLFELYKLQKSMDWSEDEVDLSKARADMKTCNKSEYEAMLLTLGYQLELDSIASRSVAPLIAPFVTNSELWTLLMKISEIENLHSLTYSEIIRQCLPNPDELFEIVTDTDQITSRATTVHRVFDDFKKISGLKTAGSLDISKNEQRKHILKFMVALYALEGVEFMASFAVTFNLAERGMFIPIAQLVQKIANDEMVHYTSDREVLKILMSDPEWAESFKEVKEDAKKILDEVIEQEFAWSEFLFSGDRQLTGLNKTLLDEWVLYRANPLYKFLDLQYDYETISENPLMWMDNWLDQNKQQSAPQEMSVTNYQLNSVKNDIQDDFEFEL